MSLYPCVRTKPGFAWTIFTPGGFRLLATIDGLARRLGHDVTLTAGTNDHQAPDPHALGNAFDLRTSDWSMQDILDARVYLQSMLGPHFTVLYECPTKPETVLSTIAYVNPHASAPHYHLQVKNGETWPPVSSASLNA